MDNCYFTIGREGHIKLDDHAVSRQHAEILIKNGEIYLRDLESTNGTFLVKNHRRVHFVEGYVQLNQLIAIGNSTYSVKQLLEMTGADEVYNEDGTTHLSQGTRPLYLSHPRQKISDTNWAHH